MLLVLVGCSAEQKEINRQEEIINEFLELYFDGGVYGAYDCPEDKTYVIDGNEPEFYTCTLEMFEDVYSEYLSEEIVSKAFLLPYSRSILNSFIGDDFPLREVEYKLIVPESLDFPNVFQVEVKEETYLGELEYYINVKVEGEIIVQFSQHRKY